MDNKTVMKIARACYDINVMEKAAELTMYGEVVETQPRNWLTGEFLDGQFIVLKDFLEDLKELKGIRNLTIHLNSVGGDAYSSLAIHNRLREMSNNGMKITCNVDGVAMSGGSLIMCAADTVRVNPSSIIMIHDCWQFIWDCANASDLRKMADEMDVINNSQAEIYTRKTGKSLEEIRDMMKTETYMSGRQALEHGFADELIDNAEDPEISVSADKQILFAHGRRMRIAAMGKLPDGIKVIETEPETDGGDNNLPDDSGKKAEVTHMTFEDFRKENPEAAEAAIAEAKASVSHDDAIAQATAAERQRCQEIDELNGVFDAETIFAAKYGENPCTAQEMSFRAAQEMAKQGRSFLNQMKADYKESGADAVGAAPAAAEEDKPMTADDMKALGAAMAKKLRGEKTEEV